MKPKRATLAVGMYADPTNNRTLPVNSNGEIMV